MMALLNVRWMLTEISMGPKTIVTTEMEMDSHNPLLEKFLLKIKTCYIECVRSLVKANKTN